MSAVTVADIIARIERKPPTPAQEIDSVCEQLAMAMAAASKHLDVESSARIRVCILRLRTLEQTLTS